MHVHQIVSGLGLSQRSAYDQGMRVLLVGWHPSVKAAIREMDRRNKRQRDPPHLYPRVAEYARMGGRLYLFGRDIPEDQRW